MEPSSNPIERIRALYNKLSKTQKKIADFLLEQSDKACFMSLNELSMQVGVTQVTVMKFVRLLGYPGFSEFRREYQAYFQAMIAPRSVVREALPDMGDPTAGGARRIMENELSLLRSTYDLLGEDRLREAVTLMLKARKIFLVARGICLPIAELLQTRLTFLCMDSEILKLDNLVLLPRALARADERDLFVFFTFPNYSPSLGDVAQCARLRGSSILTITDKTTAPPACHSDLVILCYIESTVFYNSMTAPLSVVNILAELLAVEARDSLERRRETYQALASILDKNG